ncbi:hypothetical protein [Pseudomonas sputi]|uniref:hypothetical protein n=1 Tax=Pseudomonas sputi TaxID=2892325 RepID=UPI001F1A3597|nr:hypothetical protein [Pseudomonas sputi]
MGVDQGSSIKQKIVLFIGNADYEGVTAKLKTVGTPYKRKMLESRPDNWKTIISIFHEYDVSCVVAKLTSATFHVLCRPQYSEVRRELLELISGKPNLLMAHESILIGDREKSTSEHVHQSYDFDPDLVDDYEYELSDYSEMFVSPSTEIVDEVVELFSEYGMIVVPYRKNVELVVVASSFVEKNESNLIFRIYVPSERMWANEAEKLLQLFREYLQKVSGLNVRHDQYRTNQGVVYEFFGGESLESNSLPQKFNEFSTFMEMCVTNPHDAQFLLASSHLNKIEVFDLVERYSKEARRLHVDIKQERERKLLAIRHGLEAELAEYVRTEQDWSVINRLVESSIPAASGVLSSLTIDRHPLPEINNNLTFNINSQIIEKINGVVAQQIHGNQHLGVDGKQLLELIEQYGAANKAALASAVHELADESAKSEDRISAKQKLKGFLFSIGGKIGDVATGVLQTYIEQQIGL